MQSIRPHSEVTTEKLCRLVLACCREYLLYVDVSLAKLVSEAWKTYKKIEYQVERQKKLGCKETTLPSAGLFEGVGRYTMLAKHVSMTAQVMRLIAVLHNLAAGFFPQHLAAA